MMIPDSKMSMFLSTLMPELVKLYKSCNSVADISKLVYFAWLL